MAADWLPGTDHRRQQPGSLTQSAAQPCLFFGAVQYIEYKVPARLPLKQTTDKQSKPSKPSKPNQTKAKATPAHLTTTPTRIASRSNPIQSNPQSPLYNLESSPRSLIIYCITVNSIFSLANRHLTRLPKSSRLVPSHPPLTTTVTLELPPSTRP